MIDPYSKDILQDLDDRIVYLEAMHIKTSPHLMTVLKEEGFKSLEEWFIAPFVDDLLRLSFQVKKITEILTTLTQDKKTVLNLLESLDAETDGISKYVSTLSKEILNHSLDKSKGTKNNIKYI
jgi:ABC-type uncharacterized transport system involved in gliding motility auxiliary subunit